MYIDRYMYMYTTMHESVSKHLSVWHKAFCTESSVSLCALCVLVCHVVAHWAVCCSSSDPLPLPQWGRGISMLQRACCKTVGSVWVLCTHDVHHPVSCNKSCVHIIIMYVSSFNILHLHIVYVYMYIHCTCICVHQECILVHTHVHNQNRWARAS